MLDDHIVNAAGGSKTRQLHDHRQMTDAIIDEIDQRDHELIRQIGEYQASHSDATPRDVATALRHLGCTVGDVENRQAVLDQLAAEQANDQKVDIDVEDATAKRGTRREWVKKRP